MPLFAVTRAYGASFRPGLPLEAQADWPAHAAFMDGLEAEGFARLAGPLEGTGEALIIVRAASAEEIESRLAGDPWTANGTLVTRRIAPWTLRVGEVG
ncbi:MAG: YciI family protein [Caulobacteraceae bacterium]